MIQGFAAGHAGLAHALFGKLAFIVARVHFVADATTALVLAIAEVEFAHVAHAVLNVVDLFGGLGDVGLVHGGLQRQGC